MKEFRSLKRWLIVAKIQMKKIWLNLSTAELQLSKKWFNSISWELLCKKIHLGKLDSWLNVDSYHHTLLYHNPMKNKTELFATETDENYSIILKDLLVLFWNRISNNNISTKQKNEQLTLHDSVHEMNIERERWQNIFFVQKINWKYTNDQNLLVAWILTVALFQISFCNTFSRKFVCRADLVRTDSVVKIACCWELVSLLPNINSQA